MDYERRNGYNDIKEVRTDSSEEIQKWVKDEDDRRKMCKVPKSNMSLEEEMKFIKDKTQIKKQRESIKLGQPDIKEFDDEIENGRFADMETTMKLYT